MKKTIGQLYYEHVHSGQAPEPDLDDTPWEALRISFKVNWEKAARELLSGFELIRNNTNCNDEQTDDTSGVPVNAYTQY